VCMDFLICAAFLFHVHKRGTNVEQIAENRLL